MPSIRGRGPGARSRSTARFVAASVLVPALAACGAPSDSGNPVERAPLSTTSTIASVTTGTTTLPVVTTTTAPPATTPPTTTVPPTTVPPATTTPDVPSPPGEATTVERVVDGDTIVVAGGERVRLIGIDTPETVDPRRPVECFGKEASRHLATLLPPGEPITLEHDVERADRYGRTLAYVYRARDGIFVNEVMVRDGYANVATYPPNVAYVDRFVAAERAARDEGAGLWSAC